MRSKAGLTTRQPHGFGIFALALAFVAVGAAVAILAILATPGVADMLNLPGATPSTGSQLSDSSILSGPWAN